MGMGIRVASASAVIVAAIACKSEPAPRWLVLTSRIDGEHVEVKAECPDESQDFTFLGDAYSCYGTRPATIRVRAGRIGAGKQTLTFLDEDRELPPMNLIVDVPASAVVPFLAFRPCTAPVTDGVELEVALPDEEPVNCRGAKGSRFTLSLEGSPGGVLAIGGEPKPVPAAGLLEYDVDLGVAWLDEPIERLVDVGDESASTLPFSFSVGGNLVKDGIVTFGFPSPTRKQALVATWLVDVAEGNAPRTGFAARAAGAPWKYVFLRTDRKSLYSGDRTGSLRDVHAIALGTPGERVPSGACRYQDLIGNPVRVRKTMRGISVRLVSLADGSTVAEQTFPPADGACPGSMMLEPGAAVDIEPHAPIEPWIEGLASR